MNGRLRIPRAAAALVLVTLALLSSACGLYKDEAASLGTPTATGANLLQNPGFESGAAGWSASGGDTLTTDGAERHSGTSSAVLSASGDNRVAAGQLLTVIQLPEFVSGFYRADDPPSDTFVGIRVTLRGGTIADGQPEHVLHLVLAGDGGAPQQPPTNERYFFVSRAPAKKGTWTYFGYPVGLAVTNTFGASVGFDAITLAIEAGGDGARVRFDDLYAGPQLANPNRPPQK